MWFYCRRRTTNIRRLRHAVSIPFLVTSRTFSFKFFVFPGHIVTTITSLICHGKFFFVHAPCKTIFFAPGANLRRHAQMYSQNKDHRPGCYWTPRRIKTIWRKLIIAFYRIIAWMYKIFLRREICCHNYQERMILEHNNILWEE